jgi:hypothetical protein
VCCSASRPWNFPAAAAHISIRGSPPQDVTPKKVRLLSQKGIPSSIKPLCNVPNYFEQAIIQQQGQQGQQQGQQHGQQLIRYMLIN